MRQSFKTVQCFWQWCIGIYAGTILPEVQMEGGEEGYMLYYSLTEKKNQSILINNIQNSQEDLNWIHLRCHQGSNPHWPTSWLGRALFSSITSKIWVDLITFTVHHSLWREDSSFPWITEQSVHCCSKTFGEGRGAAPTSRRLSSTARGWTLVVDFLPSTETMSDLCKSRNCLV